MGMGNSGIGNTGYGIMGLWDDETKEGVLGVG